MKICNMSSKVECPLCTQIGFQSVDALRVALVSAASRNLTCPICLMSLTGLDKLTVHLFSHTLPQHELQNSAQSISINSVNLDQMAAASTIVNSGTLMAQELNPKIGVLGTNILQNIGSLQSERPVVKALETAPVYSQDLSNLLYWLPVSCFPEKLANSSINPADSVNNNVSHIRIDSNVTQVNQESEHMKNLQLKVDNVQGNKGTSYIIVNIPPLQDMKKQNEVKLSQDSCKTNTTELNLSEISNLSGKLLMLECGNNVTFNNGCSQDKSQKQFPVEISMPSDQQGVPNTSPNNVFSPNREISNHNRETSSLPSAGDMRNEGDGTISKLAQSGNDTKQPGEAVRCQLCHIQFVDSNILALHHQLVHEGPNPAQNTLESPDKRFSPKENDQPSASTNAECFQCHMCSKKFQKQGSLMVHIRVAHTAPGFVGLASRIKESTSAVSPTSAASTTVATAGRSPKEPSQTKVNDNKQWECSECGKFFTTKYFLKKHKRLHTGEMPYSCPTCSKSFTFQQSYHKHIFYHSDEKPHTCNDCGRSFKELSTLHNHQRIHTGEKPWACETCGKCFRQRVSYLVHRRIHTGAMPYCCTACNKSFRYKVSQRTHKCTAQPPGSVVRQPGDLLQRLLFGNSGENPAGGKMDDNQAAPTREQTDPGTLRGPTEPTESSGAPVQSHEQGTHFLYSSVASDKSVFSDRLQTNAQDFNLQNFSLQQQIVPSLQSGNNLSQGSEVLQNVSVSDLKHTTSSEKVPMNVCNSSWCVEEQPAGKSIPNLNASSLVVVVNEKEPGIPVNLPDSCAPITLLQVLQKEKSLPKNDLCGSLPASSSNDLQCNATSASDITKNNMILSAPYVPDFLSMVISAASQNQNAGSGCSDSNVPVGDPFQWEVSLDMPNDIHNSGINNNANVASQEAIDSLQTLLFGGPPAHL